MASERGPVTARGAATRGAALLATWVTLSVLAGLAGCSGDSSDDPTGDASPETTPDASSDAADDALASVPAVELGTDLLGTGSWQPIATDEPFPLFAGPQGGHHFVVHSRMRGLEPGYPSTPGSFDNPATRFTAEDSDGGRLDVSRVPYRIGYREGEDGWLELPTSRIVVVEEDLVPALDGSLVRLRVEVVDRDSVMASDEVEVEVYLVPLLAADVGPPAVISTAGRKRR